MNRDYWNVEYTDTYGGEANYCWVKRATVNLAPIEPDSIYTSAATVASKRRAYRLELMRKAKAAMGLTGTRGKVYDSGDMIEFRPYGACTVMYITWKDSGDE